jgi:hypothetical protein
LWLCRCDCGGEILCHSSAIKNRDNTSCGCGAPRNEHIRAFLAKNANNGGCWEWPGARDKDGYCHTKFDGWRMPAHRAVFKFAIGEIPDSQNACHHCDNPPCCRPDHLFAGTQKDNCDDAKAKDRHSRGERNGIAKLTDEAVRYIRASNKTQWELADEFDVWQGTISCIKRRTRWTHVQD